MRLNQKPDSKRGLQKKVEQLQSELEQLKSQSNQDLDLIYFIRSFAKAEKAILLTYSDENKTFHPATTPESEFSKKFHFRNYSDFIEYVFPEDQENVDEFFNTLSSRKKRMVEFRVILVSDDSKDTKYISLEIIPPRNDNAEINYTCIFRDISKDQKLKKELIKSKEKAEEADKLKTIFLSNISHHIRTPMNSIVGFAEILSLSDPGKEKRKEYLSVIKQQSKSLLHIIDDVSELAKLEVGLLNITKSLCNLNLILNEILIRINEQRAIKRKEQVEIHLTIPDESGLEIYSDSGRLQQVISNILAYSLRYTEKGFIELGYSLKEDNKIEFFIKDSGPGLSKDEQKQLFNKYKFLDFGENLKYEDSGLGLTIAQAIVKMLNGKIWVDSEPGKGTNIHFTIPYETAPKQVLSDVEEELMDEYHYDWRDKVILIAEDEEVNGMFLETLFQDTHAQTIYAKNGVQAVDLCNTINKIDLILMDIKMPVMNGLRATQEIRKFNTKIPIIAQTALASEEDKHLCLLAGCNETITKPIEVEELLLLVNKYLTE